MKTKLLQLLAAFLTIVPMAFPQAKTKLKDRKLTLLEFNQKVLKLADKLGIDLVNQDLSKEDLDILIENLKLEGIDIKKIDIKESLLGTQGAVD